MKTKSGDLMLNNYSREAASCFLNYRVPAAIIAMASLHSFIRLTRIHHQQDRHKNKTALEQWVVTMCHLHLFISFVLSIIVLILSTSTEVHIYRDEFMPVAENTYELLNNQFHFEFAAIRWCFISCAFTLLRGAACHILLEFNLLRKENLREAAIVFTGMVSVLSGLFSYINNAGTLLLPWHDWFSMTKDLAKMIWINAFSLRKPFRVVSAVSFGLCIGLTAHHYVCCRDKKIVSEKIYHKPPAQDKVAEEPRKEEEQHSQTQ